MDNAEPIQTAEDEADSSQLPAIRERDRPQLVAQDTGVLAILPRDVDEAARYADGIIKAGLVPDSFREGGKKDGAINPAAVMMGVLKSMELGVAPQTGLAGLYMINNRFSVFGDLAQALVQRTGHVRDHTVSWIGPAFDEESPLGDWPLDFGCEVRFWRVGQDQPYIGRYTVRDAKRAKLWMNSYKQPWLLYPKRMLFNRARAFALRDGFADGLHGLSIAEEVIDAQPLPVEDRGESKRLSSLIDEEAQDTAIAAEAPEKLL